VQKYSSLPTLSLNRATHGVVILQRSLRSVHSLSHSHLLYPTSLLLVLPELSTLDPSTVASLFNSNPLLLCTITVCYLFTISQAPNSSLSSSKTLLDSLPITPARWYRQIHKSVVLYRDYHSPKQADRTQVKEPLLVTSWQLPQTGLRQASHPPALFVTQQDHPLRPTFTAAVYLIPQHPSPPS